MKQLPRFFLVLCGCLVVTVQASASWPPGSLLHPIGDPPPDMLAECQSIPACARDHVYVYFINGVDPANLCNLRGEYDYLRKLGFGNVYFGQLWDGRWCVKAIRQVRSQDPEARIVLLGYSAGASVVRDICRALKEDGTCIDLLVYQGGDMLTNCPKSHPINAARVINIRAWGVVFLAGGFVNGADLDGCENYHLGVVRHACVPANKRLLELVGHELTVEASCVLESAPGVTVSEPILDITEYP